MGTAIEFDDQLLSAFMDGFWGYGNFKGRYWFIGMEEGGGNSLEEIKSRVRLWAQRGRRELDDVAEYHRALGMPEFFTQPTKSQRTWNKLIRMVLAARTPTLTLEMVKLYQRERLGRLDGETCLLELLPLPSPSTSKWIYSHFAAIERLQSRETYRKHYGESRASYLKSKITHHRPSAVVFYGVHGWYREWWEEIAGTTFEPRRLNGEIYFIATSQSTRFLIVKHPVSKGITNDYFHQMGRLLLS